MTIALFDRIECIVAEIFGEHIKKYVLNYQFLWKMKK